MSDKQIEAKLSEAKGSKMPRTSPKLAFLECWPGSPSCPETLNDLLLTDDPDGWLSSN